MYYGLTRKGQAEEIIFDVVRVLGGGINAIDLIAETAMQETNLGSYRDMSNYGAGIGLCQCDPIAFDDTKARTKNSVKAKIMLELVVNIDGVSHIELAHSPMLAAIWCRLHYLLRPGAIPDTVLGRAEYWKHWYNSELGRGTVAEYVHNESKLESFC